MLAEEEVIQAGDDTGGNGGPWNGSTRFPHRDGFIPQLLGEILRLLGDIDADADDRAIDGAAFGIAGELGEDAADLAAVEDDIIGPLDGRGQAMLLQHLADSQPGAAGKQTERGGVEIRAEKIREINPLPGRRGKAAAQAAVAVGLAIRQHNSAGGRALQGQLHPAGIGRIGLLVANDGLSPALRQVLLQQFLCHAIRQGGKAVAQPGDRFDGIALLPQAAGGLPHRGAADAQPDGKLLPGVVLGTVLPQLPQQLGGQISFCHDEVPPFCGRNVNFPLNNKFLGSRCRWAVENPQ